MQLSQAARRLLWAQGFFSLANALSGVFTGVYLWRLRPGVETLAQYNFWVFFTVMVGMPALGGLAKRWGAAYALVAGNSLYAFFYLILLLLKDQAGNYLAPLGLLMGLALSFYATSDHVLAYDLTADTQRERYYSLRGLATTIATLVAPVTSGWLVASFAGTAGYTLIFGFSFLFFTLSAYLGLGLRYQRPPAPYQIRRVLPGPDPRWHRVLLAFGLYGLRDGIFGFIINLLVFLSAGSERGLGNYTFLTSLLGLGAFYLAGRVMKPANRPFTFFLGALLMAAAPLFLLLGVTWWTMLLFGAVVALANPLWSTALGAVNLRAISEVSRGEDLRVEFICAREVPLGFGRLAGILLFLWLARSGGGQSTVFLQSLLPVLGLAFFVVWLLLRRLAEPIDR